jgi:hypothetical protein
MPYPIESGIVTDDNLPDYGRRFCPDCRRTQDVHDRADETEYVGRYELAYVAYHLACGHSVTRDSHRVGASPGGRLTGSAWDR